MALWNKLMAKGVKPSQGLDFIFEQIAPELIEQKRYEEFAKSAGDLVAATDQRLARTAMSVSSLQRNQLAESETESRRMIEFIRNRAVGELMLFFEAAAGVKKDDDARKIASKILELENTGATAARMVESAARAGNADLARDMAKKWLETLPQSERAAVEAALAKLG
jgi:hypothetical protein